MGTLPPTGTQMSMGRVGRAYNNVAPGSQSVSIGNSASMRLNERIGRGNVPTPLSQTFGGRGTPFPY